MRRLAGGQNRTPGACARVAGVVGCSGALVVLWLCPGWGGE